MRAGVGVVALDPWRGYLGPARELLPEATVTVDRFHMVRLANQVVTEVRQRTQQDVMGHRGRKGDPLYDIRRLLLVGEERLSPSARRRIDAALAHTDGDRYDEVACAWVAKELLRQVYAAENLRSRQGSGWKRSTAGPRQLTCPRSIACRGRCGPGKKRPSIITVPALPTDRPKLST